MSDLEIAIQSLPGHSIVLCRQGEVILSDKRGIAPMMDWISQGKDLRGFSAADRIVGKAAAMLFVKAGIREVYAETLSEEGKRYLSRQNIPVSFKILTDKIINRSGNGLCPMESTVMDTQNYEVGYRLLKEKQRQLLAGTH